MLFQRCSISIQNICAFLKKLPVVGSVLSTLLWLCLSNWQLSSAIAMPSIRHECPPHPCQYTMLFLVFYWVLMGEKWHRIVILICTSLITSEIEHLFIYARTADFSVNFIHILCLFLNWIVHFLYWFAVALYIEKSRHLSAIYVCNIFS